MRRNFLLLDVVLLAVSAAVLIVFAVPSLTRLRAAALEAGCMGNLDLGMKAFASYAADNDGWIFSHLPGTSESVTGTPWGETLYQQRRLPLEVLRCPMLEARAGDFINTYGMLRTTLEPGNHFYHARIRRWGDFARNGRGALYYQTSLMKVPDQVMTLGDTEIYEGDHAGRGFFAYHPVVPAAGSAFSLRHDRKGNLSFADGHAAAFAGKVLIGLGFNCWVEEGSAKMR